MRAGCGNAQLCALCGFRFRMLFRLDRGDDTSEFVIEWPRLKASIIGFSEGYEHIGPGEIVAC